MDFLSLDQNYYVANHLKNDETKLTKIGSFS